MRPIALLALALLAGCGAVVPTTAARLAGLSPLEADPSGFEIALDLPPGLGLPPGGARLRLSAANARTGESSDGVYVLARTEDAAGVEPLVPGGGVVALRIAEADLARLRAQQALIRRWKEADDAATSGSLALSLTGCRQGDGPAAGAEGAAWLRIESGGAFLPLVRPRPVAELLDSAAQDRMGPCPR